MLKEDWEVYAKRLGYGSEHAMFHDLYITKAISVIALGERLGFTRGTIARRLDVLGIAKRSRGGANNQFCQRIRLWRFDQRMICYLDKADLAKVLQISPITIANYLASLKEVK